MRSAPNRGTPVGAGCLRDLTAIHRMSYSATPRARGSDGGRGDRARFPYCLRTTRQAQHLPLAIGAGASHCCSFFTARRHDPDEVK